MAGCFEVQAMVQFYHQHKVIWNASIGKNLECLDPSNVTEYLPGGQVLEYLWVKYFGLFLNH